MLSVAPLPRHRYLHTIVFIHSSLSIPASTWLHTAKCRLKFVQALMSIEMVFNLPMERLVSNMRSMRCV